MSDAEYKPGLRIFHHYRRSGPGAVDLVDHFSGKSKTIAENIPRPAAIILALRRRRSRRKKGQETPILDYSKSLVFPEEY